MGMDIDVDIDVLGPDLPEETEENHTKFSQESRSGGRVFSR
jgi:hypothetical protein